ncbi:RING-H2 finger protein ATL65 [Malania oleifera]|uniref:RING-H2 finger protein ATL65 n=1 Tax=Malania oleifera TaxID=397392 RepID=UPI0025AD9D63|nr:RING-H2 finger protein ATL65 [Malania oleifera]
MTGPVQQPYPSVTATATATDDGVPIQQSKLPVDFSPPLIAMVVVVAAAFLLVTYSRLISRHLLPPFIRLWRRWRRRRRLRRLRAPSSGDIESPPFSDAFQLADGFHVYSPYGLDESVIKTLPLSVYTAKGAARHGGRSHECAVCLLEFEDDDYVRTLPVCSHAFHVDCIDIWLRSHANCPLCRAGIFRPESPFIPVMAARIRPSLDDGILESIILGQLGESAVPESETSVAEIRPFVEGPSPRRTQSEDRFNGRDFLLKRSYSFGFERNFPSERLVLEPATASPWRYRRSSFWGKRPSPFGSLTKSRVFSFRYYRGMKSPFFRRRSSAGGVFFPLSESSVRFAGGGGSSSRSKSMTSPMFGRPAAAMAFSSSRLRCGDPEALLSPERYNNRR